MKRVYRLIIGLMAFFFIYQFIVLLFVKEHNISYKIAQQQEIYTILEVFVVNKKEHIYSFEIEDENHKKYHFQAYENYGKQKKIITSIEAFEEKDLTCIYPILKGKRQSQLLCQKKGEEVSPIYLLENGDKRIKTFLNKLAKKGYKSDAWNLENLSQTRNQVTYYPKNIDMNQIFYIWNYQGVSLLRQKEGLTEKKFLQIDKYENDQSILVDSAFLVMDSDQKYDCDKLYVVTPSKVDTILLEEKISQDSYFCGSVEGHAYLIDRKAKRQYEINPKSKQVKLIGNTTLNAQYYNGEHFVTRNIYDFLKEDLFFATKIPSKLEKKYPNAAFYPARDRTYFVLDNRFYYVSNAFWEDPVLLFSREEPKEIQVRDNQLFVISKDTLYKYSVEKGLRPIFTSREFLFNTKNIYASSFQK